MSEHANCYRIYGLLTVCLFLELSVLCFKKAILNSNNSHSILVCDNCIIKVSFKPVSMPSLKSSMLLIFAFLVFSCPSWPMMTSFVYE